MVGLIMTGACYCN